MAGIPPFFFTGGNAKIKVNGVVLAFCADFSYSIQVAHQRTNVLGMYESTSVEPLSYKVSGSFTVIRYMESVKGDLEGAKYGTPHGTSDSGNGIGGWTTDAGTDLASAALKVGAIGNNGRANEALDPSTYQNGTFFDIEVFQKMPDSTQKGDRGVAQIRSCRVTQVDFSVAKRSPAMQRYTFEALYLDEDSFLAGFSGQGQQFAQ